MEEPLAEDISQPERYYRFSIEREDMNNDLILILSMLSRSFLESFVNMSYMYYSVFGSFVCVFVGIVVSLFTNTESYDSKLVHPMVSRFVKSKSAISDIDEKPRHVIVNSISATTEKQREKV